MTTTTKIGIAVAAIFALKMAAAIQHDVAIDESLRTLTQTVSKKLPLYSQSRDARWDSIQAGHRKLTYYYTWFVGSELTQAEIDQLDHTAYDAYLDGLAENVRRAYDTSPDYAAFRRDHIVVVFIYHDEYGHYLGQRSVGGDK